MGLLRTIILGRDNGIRARLRRRLRGEGAAPEPAPAPAPSVGERALRLSPEPPRDVTPPEGFEVVLHKDALKPGRVTDIIIGGTAIAVANVDGAFYAVDNTCPHAGGPLGEGTLDGAVLVCPMHGWRFDLATGACETDADTRVRTFETRVVGDAVCVRL